MPRRFSFVCVDAIGTLLRVRGSVGAVYAPVAARHGLHAEPAAIDAVFRVAFAAAPPAVFSDATPAAVPGRERTWWHDVVARTMAPLDRAPGFEAFFSEVFEHFRTAAPWELLPGAREALTELRAEGRRLAVVSDMDTRLHDVLAAFDLTSMFDPIALASQLNARKADGSLFRAALALAGARPAETVHIGDRPDSDVAGARAAGITPILFDPGSSVPASGVAHAGGWPEVPMLLHSVER